jgi:hypothetical protein
MPCYDERSNWIENPETKHRLNAATRAACEMSKLVDRSKLSKETRKWVEAHDEMDRRREAAEKTKKERETTKKKALEKLTPAEKKALGL